jgi:hypothetical protein
LVRRRVRKGKKAKNKKAKAAATRDAFDDAGESSEEDPLFMQPRRQQVRLCRFTVFSPRRLMMQGIRGAEGNDTGSLLYHPLLLFEDVIDRKQSCLPDWFY